MQGDFASRRLPAEWVQACDVWLSACVSSSTRQLGSRWLDTYLSAPVWRFAWGPGVVDHQWWFGVLMPSCDNVGRYFPMVIVQQRAVAPTDRIGLDHLDLWWAHLARSALATLAEGATLEAFETALHDAPPWPFAGAIQPVAALTSTAGRCRQTVPAGATLGDITHALAAAELQQRLSQASFWWPLRSGGGAGSCTVLAGLPPPQAFAEMLAGNW